MFFHENEKCPVCDKLFTSDDDIVICPRCGTPHHRECYNQLGHCANSDKHKDGFVYTAPKIDADVQSNSDDNAQTSTFNPNNSYYSNTVENKATKHKCNNCGQEIDNTAPFCFKCGAKQDNPDYKQYVNVNIPFENQSDYGNTILSKVKVLKMLHIQ
jgi:hypothetical protein